jgi:hypothetical protein
VLNIRHRKVSSLIGDAYDDETPAKLYKKRARKKGREKGTRGKVGSNF